MTPKHCQVLPFSGKRKKQSAPNPTVAKQRSVEGYSQHLPAPHQHKDRDETKSLACCIFSIPPQV